MSDNKSQDKTTPLQYYLNLGLSGQFPLFFKDWLNNLNLSEKDYKVKEGTKLLKKYFKKIEIHKTVDKKKIAISAMEESEREEFLKTFFYVLEEEILNSEHKYH